MKYLATWGTNTGTHSEFTGLNLREMKTALRAILRGNVFAGGRGTASIYIGEDEIWRTTFRPNGFPQFING